MTEQPDAAWLRRVRALQSIAQEGLAYTHDPFDAARFTRSMAERLVDEFIPSRGRDGQEDGPGLAHDNPSQ